MVRALKRESRTAQKKPPPVPSGALLRTRSKIGGAARSAFGSHYWVGLQAPDHLMFGSQRVLYRFVKSIVRSRTPQRLFTIYPMACPLARVACLFALAMNFHADNSLRARKSKRSGVIGPRCGGTFFSRAARGLRRCPGNRYEPTNQSG